MKNKLFNLRFRRVRNHTLEVNEVNSGNWGMDVV